MNSTTNKTRFSAVVGVVLVLAISFVFPVVGSASVSYDPTDDLLEIFVKVVEDGISIQEQLEDGEFTQDYYDLWYGLAYNDEYQVEKYHDAPKIDETTGTFSNTYLEWYEYYYDQYNVLANPILWDDFCTYAKQRYLDEVNGGSVSADTTAIITSAQQIPQVKGDDFAAIVERLNKQYAPEASSGRFSWKEDYRCTTNGVAFGRFYSEGEFLNGKNLDLYLIPFYDDGEHVYFPLSQYHFTQKTTFNDSGGLSSLMIYYKLITSTDHTAITEDVAFLNSLAYRYADLGFGVYRNGSSAFGPYMAHYDSYSNYVNIKPLSAGNMANISYTDYYSDYMRYFYYDLNEAPIDHYTEMVYYNADPSTVNTDIDFGFYYSDKPITMKFSNIVPSNIDSDSVVTLDGENIYDYTITGAEGSTVTLGDYIQNNYTYITNNYGGSSGDGSASLPSVPDVELDLDEYLNGVDDYVSTAEGFFQSVYKIIPAPMMNVLIASFGLIVVVGVIKIVFILK